MNIDYPIVHLAIYIKPENFKIRCIQTICINTRSIINIIFIKGTIFFLNNKFKYIKK